MKKLIFSFSVLLLLTGLFSCGNPRKTTPSQKTPERLTEKQLIVFNRRLLRQEKKQIDAFIRLKHWKMKVTGTGLRYQVLSPGKGAKAHTGQRAVIRYSVEDFYGHQFYSGVKSFKIGFGGVASGLEEGILFMRVGEKARFVLPSHLAYGLSGDGDKVPPHTPIIYYVELLKLK
jgi:FKBP-type peptidyl-prolyl cis-trans isomerase FkpA